MARLIIEGDKKQLQAIAKQNRLRASKYSLKISIEEQKAKTAAKKAPAKAKPKNPK